VKRYKIFSRESKKYAHITKERVAEKLLFALRYALKAKRDAKIQKNYSKETYFANSLSMASAVLFSATQMFVECSP
jgi:hypothetical protein